MTEPLPLPPLSSFEKWPNRTLCDFSEFRNMSGWAYDSEDGYKLVLKDSIRWGEQGLAELAVPSASGLGYLMVAGFPPVYFEWGPGSGCWVEAPPPMITVVGTVSGLSALRGPAFVQSVECQGPPIPVGDGTFEIERPMGCELELVVGDTVIDTVEIGSGPVQQWDITLSNLH
jgi:hypothetical protein